MALFYWKKWIRSLGEHLRFQSNSDMRLCGDQWKLVNLTTCIVHWGKHKAESCCVILQAICQVIIFGRAYSDQGKTSYTHCELSFLKGDPRMRLLQDLGSRLADTDDLRSRSCEVYASGFLTCPSFLQNADPLAQALYKWHIQLQVFRRYDSLRSLGRLLRLQMKQFIPCELQVYVHLRYTGLI